MRRESRELIELSGECKQLFIDIRVISIAPLLSPTEQRAIVARGHLRGESLQLREQLASNRCFTEFFATDELSQRFYNDRFVAWRNLQEHIRKLAGLGQRKINHYHRPVST